MKKAVLIAATSLFTLAAAASFAGNMTPAAPAQGKKVEHAVQKPAEHKTQAKHVNHVTSQKKMETKAAK